MFDRVLSLLMIFGLIACPLWCASGSMGCCAAKSSLQPVEQIEQQTCCCCEENSSDSKQNSAPGDSPQKPNPPSSCQGVCGGAVLEKAYQFSNTWDVMSLLPLPLDVAITVQHPESLGYIRKIPADAQSGNVGLRLRTLHMSFLC